MIIKKKLPVIVIIILLLQSCGFKVIDRASLSNFNITEISTSGSEKRINYKLKSELLINSGKNKEKDIKINLHSKKNKTIKEKNIKNQISKYKIEIIVKVTIKENESFAEKMFTVKDDGDLVVDSKHSQTLDSEKKLIELLTENLAENILDKLILELNAI